MTFKTGCKQDRNINAFADDRLLMCVLATSSASVLGMPMICTKTAFISPFTLYSKLTSCISKADNTQSVHNLVLAGEWYDSWKSASTDQDLAIILCLLPFGMAGHHFWDVLIWTCGTMAGCLLGRVMRGRWKLVCSSSWIFSTCLLNFRASRMDGTPLLNLWAAFCCHTSYLEYFTFMVSWKTEKKCSL